MLESEDVIRWCKEEDQIDMINQTNQVDPRFLDEQLASAVGAIDYVRCCRSGLLTSIPL